MTAPHQRYTYIVKSRSNRSMRFMNSDSYRTHGTKRGKHGIRHSTGRSLDQPIALCAKCFRNAVDDFVVRNGIDDLVGTCSSGKIDFEVEVNGETLSDLGLVRHDSVFGMKRQAADKYAIGHRAASIAALTRRA